MPVEVPVQPALTEPTPAPVDYEARYADIGADTSDPEQGDLPSVDAGAELPPPQVTSTTSTESFESRYSDIGKVRGTEATEAAVNPTPTPEPSPDFAARYTDISNEGATETVKAVSEVPQNPRQEEIRAPIASDIPAQLLSLIGRFSDAMMAPGSVSEPLVSKEVAGVGVRLAGGGARLVTGLLEDLTGKPYRAAEAGVESTLSQAASDFTQPEGIASLLSFAVPGVAESYAVGVLSKLPEQYGRLKESIEKHGLISAETAKAATEAGIADLLGFLAAKGASHIKLREGTVIPNAIQEPSATSEVPRASKTGQNEPVDTGRVGESNAQGQAPAGAGGAEEIPDQAQEMISDLPTEGGENLTAAGGTALPAPPSEPIGVTDTLAELNRRYGIAPELPTPINKIESPKAPEILSGAREPNEIMSPGPGAAAAGEPLAKFEPRAFAERFQDDAGIAQEIRDAAGNRFYEPISNKVTMENATEIVQERGIPQSINMLKDEGNGLDFRVRSAMGQFIIKRLNQGYERLKESSPKDAELFLNQTADLAEWQQEYGTRLGRGVQSFAMWQRITPEGKLLSLKRQMQKVRDNFTQTNGDQVKQVIAAANTGKIDALRQLAKKNPIARKLKPKFQDLIEASQPQLLTEDTFYQVAGERLGVPQFSPEIARDVLRLAHEIEAAPEGMPRDKATLELGKYIANLKGFDAKDVPLGIYYGNMLSGYNTQFVNTLDTFLNVGSEITGLAITNPKAAARIFGGVLRGFADGRTDALLALTEGRMVTDGKWLEVPKLMEIAKFGEKGGVPIRVEGKAGAAIKALSETKPAYILRGWKYVSRLMAASDAVMFRGAKEARMVLLADRVGRGEGLHGQALTNRVNEILGLDEKAAQSFTEQAASEGFTGTKVSARIAELREMARPKEANADAADYAGEATYNHEPHGVLGYFADAAAKASNKFPALKAFVPFTRIVANVTNRGLNYTPVGFKRAFYGYSGEAAPIGDAQTALIARATMGTVALGTMLALQESGALEIHGQGPSDTERRKQLQNAGWKPYSIKIGDHYFSYVYAPVGLGMSILGNMTDSYRYNELSQKDAFTRAGYAISRIGSTVFNQSFLSGLSGLFRAFSGSPGDTIASVKQSFSSTFGSFTTPTLVRDIYRLFDPTVYQTTSIAGDLLRNTPFASVINKPALNAFGESVSYPSNRFVSQVADDPAWRFIVEQGLRVPVPDKYSQVPDGDGGKRRITPEEYYSYLRDSGREIKALVLDRMGDWRTLDHDEAQKQLSAESERIREQVKRELFQ